MLRFITLRGVRAHENLEHSQRKENVIYRDWSREEELLLQLTNKQQIMEKIVEIQHKHMYTLYIGSLCNVVFPTARFTCIVTSQVIMEQIWMRGTTLFGSLVKNLGVHRTNLNPKPTRPTLTNKYYTKL